MNILFGVHNFFPIYITGTERYVLNLSKQLQRMGHRVAVLTYDAKNEVSIGEERSLSDSIMCRRYTYDGIQVSAIRRRDGTDPARSLAFWDDIECYEACNKLLSEDRWDVYHCGHPMRIAPSIWAANAAHLPIVLMLTDFWTICPRITLLRADGSCCEGPQGDEARCLSCYSGEELRILGPRFARMKDLLACCDRILSPSRFLASAVETTGIIPRGTIEHAPHGVVPPVTIPNLPSLSGSKTVTFAFIGTVLRHKGVHLLVEAFRRLNHRNARLQIWGHWFHENDYFDRVRSMADGDSRISFHGRYDHEDLPSIIRDIDVTVVPSIWPENAPLTIATSLSYRRPVIASDMGGMTEALKCGFNGIGFRPGDTASLASALQRFLDDSELLQRFTDSIMPPRRIEEEAFQTELIYRSLV